MSQRERPVQADGRAATRALPVTEETAVWTGILWGGILEMCVVCRLLY